MSDLIDRQAAIDAICKACYLSGDYQKCDGYPEESTWCEELVALRALPSAQPERKKGWWVEMGVNVDKTHNIVCSKCGEGYKTRGHAKSIATSAKWKFCPSCGADMRGESDD